MTRTADTESPAARRKAEARMRALAARDAVPAEDRARRSEALCGRLAACCAPALRPGGLVAAYCAMGSEPDLQAFVRAAFDRGCRVCIPCMVRNAEAAGPEDVRAQAPACGKARSRMAFLEIDREAFEAREASFMAQPARAVRPDDPALAPLRAVDPREIDAVVVPMVAFDRSNNRLGYGGGNYDRFLEELRDDAIVVGAAFSEQGIDEVPVEPHDRALPRIETG